MDQRATDMAIQLSDEEQKIVQDLKDLLQFGSEKLKLQKQYYYLVERQ